MTYLEYLQLPDSMASLREFYSFGVVARRSIFAANYCWRI